MYLPRHYKQDKKKSINYPLIIFLILGITFIGGIAFKWKRIISYFSGNSVQKLTKLEEKINEGINKKTFPKNLIQEYKAATLNYFDTAPIDSSASYLIAKSYYYQILDRINFDSAEVIDLTSLERRKSYLEYFHAEEDLEAMYRSALRAQSLNGKFNESESNKLFIYLYEVIVNRKKPTMLLGELSLLDSTKLNSDLNKTYVWMVFINSILSGNLEALENTLNINENLGESKIEFSPRAISYLKGIASYHNNDFVKALNFLRESKLGYDSITIEATKFEAMIFYKQNLHEKAIALLENMYTETGSQDKKIIRLIKIILASKPNLKTKIKID
ncbi:MAG TPA: hypothetical protein PK079_02765 [Leptospiraceae bacterium]|nr:hypothetical protein [Leptospiraceae bacterium]HMW04488.1 hypothetical protein [Leptospiraceae bacterium]HMX31146.1 hypothetical protein [Leptospiraceae bacterium]HMY30674.1 hypothetical protein [Leptospiraceae bacterium]HMZ63257.1 hypothetical protein [Leptospiraceae bacterium]